VARDSRSCGLSVSEVRFYDWSISFIVQAAPLPDLDTAQATGNTDSCSFWGVASIHLPMAASHALETRSTFVPCANKGNKAQPYTPLQDAEEYHIEDNAWRDDTQTSIRSKGNGTHLELYSS